LNICFHDSAIFNNWRPGSRGEVNAADMSALFRRAWPIRFQYS
jgi:hypothetical protein